MTNKELVEEFIKEKLEGANKSKNTIKRYSENLDNFIKYLGKNSVLSIKRIKVIEYKNYCQTKYANSTVNNIISTLNKFFDFLVYDLELVDKNISTSIDRPKIVIKEEALPTNEQVKALLNTIDNDRDYAIATLLFETGMRISELLSIPLKDYKEKINNSFVILGKGNKYRDVFLSVKCVEIIDKYLESRVNGCENLFTNNNGKEIHRTTISRMLKLNAEKSGKFSKEMAKNIHPHLCRHTFASQLINNDTPIDVIATAMGHSSTEVTYKTYCKIDKSRVRSALIGISY